ncbi:MAG: RDD family protein [Gammaproteobacteria bacterium]|nr:RDD family protein [Gammaproteobacteria bacterium]
MVDEVTTGAPAGLIRRLAALIYDALLAAALAFAATFAMLPLTRGEAILPATQGILAHAYHALLAVLLFTYFAFSWTRRGQTLGMRAWRIRLKSADGRRLRWSESLVRCLLGAGLAWLAILGAWYLSRPGSPVAHAAAIALMVPLAANFAWIPFDRQRRSLLDIAGRARVRRTV